MVTLKRRKYLEEEKASGLQVILHSGEIIDLGNHEVGSGIWEDIDRSQIKELILIWRGIIKWKSGPLQTNNIKYGAIFSVSMGMGNLNREQTKVYLGSPLEHQVTLVEKSGEILAADFRKGGSDGKQS